MTIKVDISDCLQQFTQLAQVPQKVADEAHRYFVAKTPIRTGNARRNTRLNNTTITADYPYAQRLDEGYSKQAPDGMVDPTLKEVDRLMQKEIKRLGK